MKNRYVEESQGNSNETKEDRGEGEGKGTGKPIGEGQREKRSLVQKYWWTCYAGAQNDGKGCKMWKVMDVKAEGRGPFVGGL